MAQKMIGRETARTGLVKPRKATSSDEDVTAKGMTTEGYPEVNAAIKKGLADVAAGRVTRMSFAEYADISVGD